MYGTFLRLQMLAYLLVHLLVAGAVYATQSKLLCFRVT